MDVGALLEAGLTAKERAVLARANAPRPPPALGPAVGGRRGGGGGFVGRGGGRGGEGGGRGYAAALAMGGMFGMPPGYPYAYPAVRPTHPPTHPSLLLNRLFSLIPPTHPPTKHRAPLLFYLLLLLLPVSPQPSSPLNSKQPPEKLLNRRELYSRQQPIRSVSSSTHPPTHLLHLMIWTGRTSPTHPPTHLPKQGTSETTGGGSGSRETASNRRARRAVGRTPTPTSTRRRGGQPGSGTTATGR